MANPDHFWSKLFHRGIRDDAAYKLLPFDAKGMLLDLLLHMPDSDEQGALVTHGTPWSDSQIAQVVGGDRDAVVALLSTLLEARIVERRKDGTLYHPLTHREARKSDKCSQAGKKGGGNPALKGRSKGGFKGEPKGSSISNSNSSSSSEGGAGGSYNLPPTLDTPEFRETWSKWVQHRREKHNKLTPTAVEQQWKRLVAMGVERATAAILHSIGQGWTGIYEETKNGNTNGNRPNQHRGVSFDADKNLTL